MTRFVWALSISVIRKVLLLVLCLSCKGGSKDVVSPCHVQRSSYTFTYICSNKLFLMTLFKRLFGSRFLLRLVVSCSRRLRGLWCLHLQEGGLPGWWCMGRNVSVMWDGDRVFGWPQLRKAGRADGIVPSRWDSRSGSFPGGTSGICTKKSDGDCGLKCACC